MAIGLWAGPLALLLWGVQPQSLSEPQGGAQQELAQQQAIPDAPRPQTTLTGVGSIAPGKGATSTSNSDGESVAAPAASVGPDAPGAPGRTLPSAPAANPSTLADGDDTTPEMLPKPGEGPTTTLRVGVNFVEVPFTVKDSKKNLVAGLSWRDVRVYENGARQHISLFYDSPFPLSVALVIDQSLGQDNMTRVNDALGAIAGAFAASDEVAVLTYNNGPRIVTDYTGAQSARLVQAIQTSKTSGREALLAGSLDGPMAQTTVINNYNVDPNTSANRGHSSMQVNAPRDVHTLNDAILAAATSLSRRPVGRRRVIYVISDGKEFGSTAKFNDVVRYLQRNQIAVYGTLVGDSAVPYIGTLDKIHLPLMMRDNILPAYAKATGGNFDSEFRIAAIEKSFAKIAEEVRDQYTIGYYSHEPFIDGKYRQLEVVVMNHGKDLDVIAKRGYYPSAASEARPAAVPMAQ